MNFNSDHIDIEQLRKYYQNKLSSSERHALEKKALSDPFLKDAMDGFDENPALFEAFYQKNKRKFNQNVSSTFLWGTIVLLALFAITKLINFGPTENIIAKTDPKSTQKVVGTPTNELDTSIESTKEIEIVDDAIQQLDMVKKEERILPEELIASQDQKKEQKIPENIVVDEPKNQSRNYDYQDEQINTTKQGLVKAPTVFMHDLFVVDYRKIDRKNATITYKRFELSGLSADRESEESSNELIEKEVQIPYVEYLDKSMAFFAKERYKEALNRYIKILEQYPDDLNALFYGGLAYFNLGKYEKSIAFFDQLLASKYDAFLEEALWYKAKTLIKLKQNKQADEILNEIIIQGGFYLKEAIALKATLK